MLEHGGLNITMQGRKFLKEKMVINLRKHVGKLKPEKLLKTKYSAVLKDDIDQALFKSLKTKRLEISKIQNVPPYVVFHDKTLLQMAIAKPMSLEEMSAISGVGEVKIMKYGQDFLEVISRYTEV